MKHFAAMGHPAALASRANPVQALPDAISFPRVFMILLLPWIATGVILKPPAAPHDGTATVAQHRDHAETPTLDQLSGVPRGRTPDNNSLLRKFEELAESAATGELFDWWFLQFRGVRGASAPANHNAGSFLEQEALESVHANHSKPGAARGGHAKHHQSHAEHKHKVQHVRILNDDKFWWLTGALLVFVAVAVVTIEVKEKGQDDGEEPLETTSPKSRQGASAEKGAESGQSANSADAGQGAGESRDESASSSATPAARAARKQRRATMTGTLLQLIFCVVGLNISMLLWGITQEYVMTNLYVDERAGHSGPGEKLPSSLFLVLCNRLGSIGFSMILSWLIGQSLEYGTVMEFAIAAVPALSNLIASWSQYSSMAYISFPLQTTAKSAKMLPVLMLSSIRGRRQTILDYAEAIVITSAVVVFGLEDSQDTNMTLRGYGALLLAAMMFFDSITPHLQDFLFEKYPDMIVIQANFAMSCLASVVCVVLLIFDGQLVNSIMFLRRHNTAILHVVVLSLCSTLSQFLITYTIKRFGPVVFIIIVTTRQIVSVCLSAMLFNHSVTALANVSAVIVFGTVLVRALWRLPGNEHPASSRTDGATRTTEVMLESLTMVLPPSIRNAVVDWTHCQRLLLCAVAMHVPLCFWAVAQEFMATHTFNGQLFTWTLLMITFNRTGGVCFALGVIYLRKLPLFLPSMKLTAIPASTNFVATSFQYQALYYIRFPQQTLMKTLKVIPVMLCGRLLKNRRYHGLEYLEAAMLTGIVCFFVWHFGLGTDELRDVSVIGMSPENVGVLVGVALMVGYLVVDSLTSNIEDVLFQYSDLDPAHMMLGAEISSGCLAWFVLLLSGQLVPGVAFLMQNSGAILHLGIQVFASASGAYACLVTVRLFGPVVFTLLMMSRQIISLVISVKLFQHQVDLVSCLCLVVVAMLIVTSTLRKASALEPPPAQKKAVTN